MLPEQGGFEACLGLHRQFKQWSLQRSAAITTSSNVNINTTSNNNNNRSLSPTPPCVGDFTPIRPIEDKEILDRFQHIPCKAGDLVCWVSIIVCVFVAIITVIYCI